MLTPEPHVRLFLFFFYFVFLFFYSLLRFCETVMLENGYQWTRFVVSQCYLNLCFP